LFLYCGPGDRPCLSKSEQDHRRWIEQCEAAYRIKQHFGLSNALEYLVGETLLHFLEAAEHHSEFAQELPYFVAEIKRVFSLAEVWQLRGAH
jgi:hypothetical protein